MELQAGQPVRIKGEHGAYTVTRIHDNHVELYGGDPHPEGRRQFRAVAAERLVPRKLTETERRQGRCQPE